MSKSDIALDEDGQYVDLIGNTRLKRRSDGKRTGYFDSDKGSLHLGNRGVDGDLLLNDSEGKTSLVLDASDTHASGQEWSGTRPGFFANGQSGYLTLGGNNADGLVNIFDRNGDSRVSIAAFSQSETETSNTERVLLDGKYGNLTLGGASQDGDLVLRDDAGKSRIYLDGGGVPNDDDIRVLLEGKNGVVKLQDAADETKRTVNISNTNVTCGGAGAVKTSVSNSSLLQFNKTRWVILENGTLSFINRPEDSYIDITVRTDPQINLTGENAEISIGDMKVRKKMIELESDVATLKRELAELKNRIPL